MMTHAPLPDTATVSARIAQLPLLPMDSIWALWDEHFDQRPNHHHRTWLESRSEGTRLNSSHSRASRIPSSA